jgi:hypothetical protein
MSEEAHKVLAELVMVVFGGAVGGFIILIVGTRIRCATDTALKRQRFRSYLTLLSRRIESRPAGDFCFTPEFKEIPKLEAEVLEVRHCVQKRLLKRFDCAVEAYKAVRFDRYSGTDTERSIAADNNNEKAKQTLVSSLGELFKCAWWQV